MKRLGMPRGVNQGFWCRLRVLRTRVFVSLRVAIDENKPLTVRVEVISFTG